MLKFKNNAGQKVMEMDDKGEVTVTDKKLEESFKENKTIVKEEDKK
jgi:hypothetical protein